MFRTVTGLWRWLAGFCLIVVVLKGVVADSQSVNLYPAPPHPDLLEKLNQDGELPSILQNRMMVGIDRPRRVISSPTGNFNMLVVLVDFSDKTWTVQPTFFDSLIFASPPSATVQSYFLEISYGVLTIVTVDTPSSLWWKQAPLPYNGSTGYVNPDGTAGTADDYGFGSYPQNLQGLAEDMLWIIDPLVNFANYDNDGDGFVESVMFAHAGPGAEITGSPSDIWSSAWNLTDGNGPGPYQTQDGVWVDNFAFDPEYMSTPGDQTIGVYCHEIGHTLFGLPDLYDYDGTSAGVGVWSLMSYGSWNGPGWSWDGSSPAWPDAWSRSLMGFESPTKIYGNMTFYPFQPVELLGGPGSGNVVRLESPGLGPQEYFLVEYRDNTVQSFDSALPGSGLLIWHIDEEKWNAWELNTYECRYTPCCNGCGIYHALVALEQADGLLNLENFAKSGDGGDSFPGTSGKSLFGYGTNPESGSYMPVSCPSNSCIAVQVVQTQQLLIYADLRVNCTQSAPCLSISVNEMKGWALGGADATYEVTVDSCSSAFEPAAVMTVNSPWPVSFYDLNTGAPIPYPPAASIFGGGAWRVGMRVSVPPGTVRGMGILSSLTVNGSMGGSATLNNIQTQVPECILLVDDDRSAPDVENIYLMALQNNKLYFDYWDVDVSGTPDAGALAAHDMVIWFTGMPRLDTLNPRQEMALASYLDSGGQLVLSSQDYLYDVGRSAFNTTYLHIMDFTDDIPSTNSIQGVPGNPVGNGIPLLPLNPITPFTDRVVALAPATSAFESLPGQLPNALTYDSGTWKVLFMAWPLEYLVAPGPDLIIAAVANWMGIPPFPITSFTVSPALACSGSPLVFTNTSQYATQFLWDFGDGMTSTLTSPVYTYTVNAPITYTVSLTGSHCCGLSVYQQPIAVHPIPNAGFTASAPVILVDDTAVFTSTSQYAESYLWDFGDGVTSTLPNPTHVYTAPMQVVVRLTVNNQCGSSVYSQANTVYGAVQAAFSPSTIRAKIGQAIFFDNTSQYAETYAWDFGDGLGSSAEVEPTYSYTQAGSYAVLLQASNPLSQDTAQVVILVSDVYTTYLPAVLRGSTQLLSGQTLQAVDLARLDNRHFQAMCF